MYNVNASINIKLIGDTSFPSLCKLSDLPHKNDGFLLNSKLKKSCLVHTELVMLIPQKHCQRSYIFRVWYIVKLQKEKHYVLFWNKQPYHSGNIITQRIPSLFSVSKIFHFLMTPTDSSNDQNICVKLLRLHLHINDETTH